MRLADDPFLARAVPSATFVLATMRVSLMRPSGLSCFVLLVFMIESPS
jgi:hypothetical protein